METWCARAMAQNEAEPYGYPMIFELVGNKIAGVITDEGMKASFIHGAGLTAAKPVPAAGGIKAAVEAKLAGMIHTSVAEETTTKGGGAAKRQFDAMIAEAKLGQRTFSSIARENGGGGIPTPPGAAKIITELVKTTTPVAVVTPIVDRKRPSSSTTTTTTTTSEGVAPFFHRPSKVAKTPPVAVDPKVGRDGDVVVAASATLRPRRVCAAQVSYAGMNTSRDFD